MRDKIIVSLTTFPARIEMATQTILNMLDLTLQPYSIELNLSKDEFSYDKLPVLLQNIVDEFPNVHINWCDGNTKVFKKLIPTVQKYYGQDYLIATIDDDLKYSNEFLAILYNYWEQKGQPDKFCLSYLPNVGHREIFKLTAFLSDLWEKLTDDVIANSIDDYYYGYYLAKHNKVCKQLDITEHKNLPDDLLVGIANDTKKISDLYCPNGRINSKFIENAINTIEKIKFN